MNKNKKGRKSSRPKHLIRFGLNKTKLAFRKKSNVFTGWVLEMFTSNQLWPYLEVVMTLATIGLLAFFAIKPTAFAISSLLGQIKSRETISLKMTSKIKNLVAAQNNYFKAEQKAVLLDEFYPEREDIAKGSAQILGLALSRSLTATTISFQPISFVGKDKDYDKIKFSFSAKGSFPDVVRFLSSLDQVYRAVKITSYSLRPETTDQDKINPRVIVVSLQGEFGFFAPTRPKVKAKS